MPIYEYECKLCGKSFEKRMSFAEADSSPECPDCASTETRKKLSLVSTLFAGGSGTYASSGGDCGSHGGFT